ncbi:MAG TPA: energy transducer TonB [Acidobacteriota bacterium]|nr:energy transducer TonB [Acidobacteriota bacterium]
MKRTLAFILGIFLLAPLVRSQGLDEINIVEMSWLLKCYRGVRPGTAKPAEPSSPYSPPAFLDGLGRDEDAAKERDLIKTTFNLVEVRPLSEQELWLKEKEPMGLVAIAREDGGILTIMLERLDTSWLHYRITAYEGNAGSEAVMRTAFSIPSSMTLKEAVVFGFEDSRKNPLFLSLRINNLYAEGATPAKAVTASPEKKPNITAPRLIERVPAVYPEAAKKAGIEGTVVLSVSLNEKGQVIRARVIKSIPELDEAALEAVRHWKYEPMTVDGKPRPIVFTVEVEFKR